MNRTISEKSKCTTSTPIAGKLGFIKFGEEISPIISEYSRTPIRPCDIEGLNSIVIVKPKQIPEKIRLSRLKLSENKSLSSISPLEGRVNNERKKTNEKKKKRIFTVQKDANKDTDSEWTDTINVNNQPPSSPANPCNSSTNHVESEICQVNLKNDFLELSREPPARIQTDTLQRLSMGFHIDNEEIQGRKEILTKNKKFINPTVEEPVLSSNPSISPPAQFPRCIITYKKKEKIKKPIVSSKPFSIEWYGVRPIEDIEYENHLWSMFTDKIPELQSRVNHSVRSSIKPRKVSPKPQPKKIREKLRKTIDLRPLEINLGFMSRYGLHRFRERFPELYDFENLDSPSQEKNVQEFQAREKKKNIQGKKQRKWKRIIQLSEDSESSDENDISEPPKKKKRLEETERQLTGEELQEDSHWFRERYNDLYDFKNIDSPLHEKNIKEFHAREKKKNNQGKKQRKWKRAIQYSESSDEKDFSESPKKREYTEEIEWQPGDKKLQKDNSSDSFQLSANQTASSTKKSVPRILYDETTKENVVEKIFGNSSWFQKIKKNK